MNKLTDSDGMDTGEEKVEYREPSDGTRSRAGQRACLLVLGMHRSGTSVITRVLNLGGVKLPNELMGASEANVSGHWESMKLYQFNDRLLTEFGYTWSDWKAFLWDSVEFAHRREIKLSIQRIIREEFGDVGTFVLKDPRICLLAPIYLEALEEAEINPRIVIPFRNPIEVCKSLRSRDQLLWSDAVLLWLRHVLEAEFFSRKYPRVFTRFSDVLEDWRRVYANVRKIAGSDDLYHVNEISGQVEEFIDSNLRHHDHSTEELHLSPLMDGWVSEVYEALLVLRNDPDSRLAMMKMDGVRSELRRVAGILGRIQSDVREEAMRLSQESSDERTEWLNRIEEREKEIEDRNRRLQEMRGQVDGLRTENEQLRNELEEINLQISSLRMQKQELIVSHASVMDHQARLEKQLREKDLLISRIEAEKYALEEEKQALNGEIASLQSELGEKEGWEAVRKDMNNRIEDLRREQMEWSEQVQKTIQDIGNRFIDPKMERNEKRSESFWSAIHILGGLMFRWIMLGWKNPWWLLRHSVRYGRDYLTVRRSGKFDREWYLSKYPDVATLNVDPVVHYLRYGASEGRNPNSWFVSRSYLRANPDVGLAGVNPFVHYIRHGALEGRQIGNRDFKAGYLCSKEIQESCDGGDFSQIDNQEVDARMIVAGKDSLVAYVDQLMRESRSFQGIRLSYVPKLEKQIDFTRAKIKLIAFYLPQFHPIPENDHWWGAGFTEWTNVTRSVPQFVGHHQPQLPVELGFYDLRVPEIQKQQIKLAQRYGISGFCYHHYWFAGKRLLERPFQQVLDNSDLDFPFCLCWANENWTRRWDGMEDDVLIAQQHSPEDDIAFIEDISEALMDPRYIRYRGRPVLLVYRVSLLPDAKATARRWRNYCINHGIGDLYLVAVRSFGIKDPRTYGFDCAIEFPPHEAVSERIDNELEIVNPEFEGAVFDYQQMADSYTKQVGQGYPLIKTVCPSWDNSARKPGRGNIFYGSTPENYARWLERAVEYTLDKSEKEEFQPPFVFINAWNEWAEGAHLEPDNKYGYGYLHATASVLQDFSKPLSDVEMLVRHQQENFERRGDVAVVVHLYYESLFDEIASYLAICPNADIFISLCKTVSLECCQCVVQRFPNVYLSLTQNRGRDVYPFFLMLPVLRQHGYELACKVHSKMSSQRSDGEHLRRKAFESLLGSEDRVNSIVERFCENPELGMVVPAGSLLNLGNPNYNINNQRWLRILLSRIGRDDLIDNWDCQFSAGTMFWFRIDALDSMGRIELEAEEFERELGQVDGALHHAIERILVVAVQTAGFVVEETPVLALSPSEGAAFNSK